MNEEAIKNEILQGLKQVDETFVFTSFFVEFDPQTRKVKGSFTAVNNSGETISEVINYA